MHTHAGWYTVQWVEDSRHSRYSTTTHPFHLHNELLKTLVGMSMLIHYHLLLNWCLFVHLRSTHTFLANSMPRVASGTARLCTSFINMKFLAKVKAPSLKGLFNSSKKRTKMQGHRVPEVQMCALKLWAWWSKLTVLSKLLSKYMYYTLNATIILDLSRNIHHVGLIFFTFFDILAEFPAFENDGLVIIQNSENSFKNIEL